MNSTDISKMFYKSLINRLLFHLRYYGIQMNKSAVIRIRVSIIIFRNGRINGIWFGSIGRKIIFLF